MGCASQLRTHTFDYIKRIEPRRVEIADPETDLVFGLSQFRQPMDEKAVKIVGVPGVDHVDMNFKPFDLPAAHIFKVRGAGQFHDRSHGLHDAVQLQNWLGIGPLRRSLCNGVTAPQ